MASLNLSVPHKLSQKDALKRVKGLLEKMKTEHSDKIKDLHEEWNGNVGKFSFAAMGFGVSGTLAVTPTHIEVAGTLPFSASFFKSKIETTIRDRAKELLA